MKNLQAAAAIVILALLVFVALHPEASYAPVPRVILFLLASIFPAILIATTAATRFQLELKGFAFVSTGASAFFLGVLFAISYLAKPALQVIAFDVIDERGGKVNLSPSYAFEVSASMQGLKANYYIKGNSVVMIFPEQVVEQKITVKLAPDAPEYFATVNYAKPPANGLRIGTELKCNPPC